MDNLQYDSENKNAIVIKLDKKKLVKAGAVVIALAIVIVLFNSLSGAGYKKPIKKSIELINAKTEASLTYRRYSTLDTQYKFEKINAEKMGEDDEAYESFVGALEDEYGDNFKVKYKIAQADKLSDKDLEELEAEIIGLFEVEEAGSTQTLSAYETQWNEEGISFKDQKKLKKAYEKYIKECGDIKVKAAYNVELECTIKGSEGKDSFDIKGLVVAKVNGQWILVEGMINPYVVHTGAVN